MRLEDNFQDSGFFYRKRYKLLEDSEPRCGMVYLTKAILAAGGKRLGKG